MIIKVTQEHIDTAHCHSCYCPIALAVKEAFGRSLHDNFVDVFRGGIIYISGNEMLLPQEADDFIKQYDEWAVDPQDNEDICLEPFEFELEIKDA
jgi:hypothetical protein